MPQPMLIASPTPAPSAPTNALAAEIARALQAHAQATTVAPTPIATYGVPYGQSLIQRQSAVPGINIPAHGAFHLLARIILAHAMQAPSATSISGAPPMDLRNYLWGAGFSPSLPIR